MQWQEAWNCSLNVPGLAAQHCSKGVASSSLWCSLMFWGLLLLQELLEHFCGLFIIFMYLDLATSFSFD